MTTYYIEAVQLVPGASPRAHEHIGSVKLTTGEVVQRSAVISALRAGDLYFTNANPPASVYAHACPYCGASDYITTIPDNTTANNLLSLPRFSPPCPIGWQPSVCAPVFYGIRDYGTVDGAPGPCRVFFPSIDGAVSSAPILEGCGSYPLILFAHGQCNEPEHYKKWELLPAQLARCGYVVAVPELLDGGEPWTDPNPDLQRLLDVADWMRSGWQSRSVLFPPSTGVVGHSRGALLAARAVAVAGGSISAYASLSGVWMEWQTPLPRPINTLQIPKLFTWGNGSSDIDADLVTGAMWGSIPETKHRAVFKKADHWDYLPAGRTTCESMRGPCSLIGALAADITSTFFGRYLPPENWLSLGTLITESLLPPALLLTPEQERFVGGHLTGFKRVMDPGFATVCGVTLGWGGTSSFDIPPQF